MRHLIPILMILALAAGVLRDATAQIAIGAKGGVNISKLSVKENGAAPEDPYLSRTGLIVGANIGIPLTPWLSLQTGGHYSQEGGKQEQGPITGLLRLSYVDVPLVAKAYLPTRGAPVAPFLYAGAVVGFEADCGLRVEGAFALDLDCETGQVERKKTDYGAVFGGGTDVRLGPGAITLDVEYVLGLRDISDDPAGEARGRVFSIAAGYKVFLGAQ